MSMWKLSPSMRGDYLILIGPFDEAFIAALKDAVPARAREWRPTAKCWRIDPEFEAVVRELIDPPVHRQEIRGEWVPGEDPPTELPEHLRFLQPAVDGVAKVWGGEAPSVDLQDPQRNTTRRKRR